MFEWYKKVVFENYANFEGRARRSEFWWFLLMHIIIMFLFVVAAASLKLPYLQSIYSLLVMLPYFGVAIRRMHDIGKSGWYILIPIYNIVLFATEGNYGENEYGSDPKNNIDSINEIGQE